MIEREHVSGLGATIAWRARAHLLSDSLIAFAFLTPSFLLVSVLYLFLLLYDAKRLRFINEGHSAKSIEIGRIKKTTGIIIEISAFPAAANI